MSVFRTTGIVKDAKFQWTDEAKTKLNAYYKQYDGKRITITVQPGESERSIRQNNFFHGPLLKAFARATGRENTKWWKAHLKMLFLSRQIKDETSGETVIEIQGTSSLSTNEFKVFLDRCIQYLVDEIGGVLTEDEQHDYSETLH